MHRAARLLLEAGAAPPILVLGSRATQIGHACRDLRVDAHINPNWPTGLGSSLEIASAHLSEDQPTLIAGCDQPGLELHHLQQLLAALRAGRSFAATRHGNRLGIPALVPGAWLRDAALRADRGLGGRLSALPTDDVHIVTDPLLHLDIDTEADVALARQSSLLDPLSPGVSA